MSLISSYNGCYYNNVFYHHVVLELAIAKKSDSRKYKMLCYLESDNHDWLFRCSNDKLGPDDLLLKNKIMKAISSRKCWRHWRKRF